MRHAGKIGNSDICPEAPPDRTIGYRLGWSDAHDYFNAFNTPHPNKVDVDFMDGSITQLDLGGKAKMDFILGFLRRWRQSKEDKPHSFDKTDCFMCGDQQSDHEGYCWGCVWSLIISVDEELWDRWETNDKNNTASKIMIRLFERGLVKPGDKVSL